MFVQDVMVSYLTTVSPSATIAEAAAIMLQKGTTSLFVTHEEKLLGVITDADILYGVVAQGFTPTQMFVWEFMNHRPPVTHPRMDILELISIMERHKLTKLPVVSEGRLVGTVTLADIASKLDLI
ncbi:MAG: CBS domain-containing protein [Actinomycetota bacterium]|nr:CBS domain-containing protein [Actinomycetota bacterium]